MKLEGQKREIFCSCNILKHLNIPFAALEGNAPYLFFLSAKKQNRVTAFLGRNYSLFPTHTVLSLDELLHVFLCSIVQTSKCKSPNHNMNKERQLTILRTTRKEGGECLECWKSMLRPTFAPPSTRLSGGRDRCAGGGVTPTLPLCRQ